MATTPAPPVIIRQYGPELNTVLDKRADLNLRFQALVEYLKRLNFQLAMVQGSGGGDPETVAVQSPSETDMVMGGAFTYPHGLAGTPKAVFFEMNSDGIFWFQDPPYDDTNLYLIASAPSITGNARVFL